MISSVLLLSALSWSVALARPGRNEYVQNSGPAGIREQPQYCRLTGQSQKLTCAVYQQTRRPQPAPSALVPQALGASHFPKLRSGRLLRRQGRQKGALHRRSEAPLGSEGEHRKPQQLLHRLGEVAPQVQNIAGSAQQQRCADSRKGERPALRLHQVPMPKDELLANKPLLLVCRRIQPRRQGPRP